MTTLFQFSTKELLGFGWEKTKKHYWYLLCVGIMAFAIKVIFSHVPIVGIFVSILLSVSLTHILLLIVKGHTPTFNDLLTPIKSYKIPLTFFLVSLLVVLGVGIGFVLLILPGIWLAVRLQFYKFVVVDKEHHDVMKAIQTSMRMTEGYFWQLFLFELLLVLFNVVGLLALGVGLFVTIPVSILAHAELYKRLSEHYHAHAHHAPHDHHQEAHHHHEGNGDHHDHGHIHAE